MPDPIFEFIQKELERSVDPDPRRSLQAVFREPVKYHGVGTARVNQIARDTFVQARHRDKSEILSLCRSLLETGFNEEAFIACDWAYRLRDRYTPPDFKVFEAWLAEYVDNWAKCDTLCNHTVAAFVEKYPEYVGELRRWARSQNRWVRRGAAVTLVLPARKGRFLKEVLEIADILLQDSDDLVQKGYGWMLKEASKPHRAEVFHYIMAHRDVMPRTALRYAIEKIPAEMRRKAMERVQLP